MSSNVANNSNLVNTSIPILVHVAVAPPPNYTFEYGLMPFRLAMTELFPRRRPTGLQLDTSNLPPLPPPWLQPGNSAVLLPTSARVRIIRQSDYKSWRHWHSTVDGGRVYAPFIRNAYIIEMNGIEYAVHSSHLCRTNVGHIPNKDKQRCIFCFTKLGKQKLKKQMIRVEDGKRCDFNGRPLR